MKRSRTHLCDSSAEWTEDVMQFYTITPGDQETFPQFHARLTDLADKCNFTCTDCDSSFKDRMIRDRLMINMDKNLRRELLDTYSKPRSMEILQKYNEDQFINNPGWQFILSYLSMAELHKIAKVHKMLQEIVISYLKAGNELRIDVATLREYPMASYPNTYARYASLTTNLCIDRVHEIFLGPLFRIFKNITTLTVRNVYTSDFNFDEEKYDLPLRSITLIDCKTCEDSESSWWDLIKDSTSLEKLHVERSSKLDLSGELTMKSIKLVEQELDDYIKFTCPHLTHLSLDYCWNGIPYKTISECTKLECLRIRHSVDWKQRLEIEALNLNLVEVKHCWEIPTEENLILKLTDDCLLVLQKFLSTEDWWNLQQTHPRFDALRVIDPQRLIEINQKSLTRFPINRHPQLYLRIGELVTRLCVSDCANDKDFSSLKYFKRLTDLTIRCSNNSSSSNSINAVFLKNIPDGLRVLSLFGDVIMDQENLVNLFCRLNPTLRELEIRYDYSGYLDENRLQGLDRLQHIEVFRRDFFRVTRELLQFLTTNKDTIKDLQLYGHGEEHMESELWRVINQMKNLKVLNIMYALAVAPQISHFSLPLLEELALYCCVNLGKLLLTLNLSKLRDAFLEGGDLDRDFEALCRGLGSIEVLEITTDENEYINMIPHIFQLINLRSLRVSKIEEAHVLPLIKGLPRLEKLTSGNALQSINTIYEVYEFLRQEGRTLILNASKIN